MKQAFNSLAQKTLRQLGISTVGCSRLQQLSELGNDIETILKMPEQHLIQLLKCVPKSRSQNRQDLFVLSELDFKPGGYFVEFGATNGVMLSNSYLLEKEFGWNGILAEPARCWQSDLRKNRNCHVDTGCVWKESNKSLTFNEADLAELSTIETCNSKERRRQAEKAGKNYAVKTISLMDLLEKYNAPSQIDFLSIDTEGSEYEILNSFNFERYQFHIIACEHNFMPNREKILRLLTAKGYARKFIGLSNWDDWYVRGK